MPSFHRVRGHILAAQIRHQRQVDLEKEQEEKEVKTEVEKKVEKENPSMSTDIHTNSVQTDTIDNAADTPIIVTKRPASVEVSMSLSLSSLDLVLTTNEHLLARAYFEDIDMNVTPNNPEVKYILFFHTILVMYLKISIHAGTHTKYRLTCIHTCTYTHTYIRAYINTYIHTYIHAYIHTYIRTYIHTYMHTYMHT